jgi:hypothetical protein
MFDPGVGSSCYDRLYDRRDVYFEMEEKKNGEMNAATALRSLIVDGTSGSSAMNSPF